MIALHDRPAVTALARQREGSGGDVEETAHITGIHRLREKVVAESYIESQALGDLPIVLHKPGGGDGTLVAPLEHGRAGDAGGVSKQEIRVRQARSRRIRTGGKRRTKHKCAD